jgi:hypothetical protein
MDEFFAATFAYPTVIFTVLLGVSVVYWLLVIIGAIGIDALDVDLDGATEGAGEGIAEGVAEGAAEGVGEGVAEGAAEGATDGAAHGVVKGLSGGTNVGELGDAMHGGFMSSLLHALDLRAAPMTVVLSVFFFFAWLLTNLGRHYLINGMGFGPVWLVGSGLMLGGVIGALPLTSILVRPLGKILKVEPTISRKDLIGKIVRIDTSRVDARFGQALAEDGGAGLIVPVRCDGDHGLRRGSQALVVSWDSVREAYEVAPVDDIVPSEALEKN